MSASQEIAAEKFIRHFKEQLRPELIRAIPDDAFSPGREAELNKRVEEIVDARLIRDKVPIGRKLRIKFIESLLADIAVARKERFGLP